MAPGHISPLSGTARSSNFSVIWNRAIDLYIERTGKDIRNPKSWTAQLQTLALCQTSMEAGPLFKKMLEDLRPPQKTAASKWRSLGEKLDTLLDVVLVFNDAAAELAAHLVLVLSLYILVQWVKISPGHSRWKGYPPCAWYFAAGMRVDLLMTSPRLTSFLGRKREARARRTAGEDP